MRSILLVSLIFVFGCGGTPSTEPTSQPTETTQADPVDEKIEKKADDGTIENAVDGTTIGNDPLAAPESVAAVPAEAVVTPTGLASIILLEGSGIGGSPQPTDLVTIHYTGWTSDGKMFDSSVKRGEPATFPLNKLIKGWQEAMPMMTRGEKRRFWIPADLAYATKPEAPQGTLVFDIELIDFKEQ